MAQVIYPRWRPFLVPWHKLYTTMEVVPVPLVPTCGKKWVYKAAENFQIFQFKGLSTWPILKFVGKDILKFVGNCHRAPSMVDQRWRTARDQRRIQRQMLDNIIQVHAFSDLRYTWSVPKYSVCSKRPFFERPSIVHPRWICGDGTERCMLCRCFTLELNRIPLPGSIMHKMCRYTLYAGTTLRSNDPSFVFK